MKPVSENQPFVFSPSDLGGQASVVPEPRGRVASQQHGNLVQTTRDEIAQIVRTIAKAAREQKSDDDFLNLFTDNVLRAMAADGVVIWQTNTSTQSNRFEVVNSLGRCTETSIAKESILTHQCLLKAVQEDQQPVFVPATPGASDPSTPANPTDHPVCLAPITLDVPDAPQYMLEVFLESEGSVATHRGYLRFAAQMADLAGEFFRGSYLRQINRSRQLASGVDDAITEIHQLIKTIRIEAATVDRAANLFGFDQTGLCYVRKDSAQLVAVSHVEQIDFRSAAAKRLQRIAQTQTVGPVTSLPLRDSDEFQNALVIKSPESDSIRLVGLSNGPLRYDQADCEEMTRLVKHAELALQHSHRLESVPGMRMLSSLSTPDLARRSKIVQSSLP